MPRRRVESRKARKGLFRFSSFSVLNPYLILFIWSWVRLVHFLLLRLVISLLASCISLPHARQMHRPRRLNIEFW